MKKETEQILVHNVNENSITSIVNWFADRKTSFYALGWIYLQNNQDIQEVFFQTINQVHEETRYVKEDLHFESWVTSIFINKCRACLPKNSDTYNEEEAGQLFSALFKLPEKNKEALVITYLKGLPFDEASQALQITTAELMSRVADGVALLSKELSFGELSGSCREYRDKFISYLGKSLSRKEKIELEIHIYHCKDCQKVLSAFQEITFMLERIVEELPVPPDFMDSIYEKAAETERLQREKRKKRSRMGLTAVGLLTFLICTGFVTGSFSSLYYSWMGWTEQEEMELVQYYKDGISEPLNLEQESNGVKVRIKTAVADDVQTLIYYEIEDMKEDSQYFINIHEGVRVENEYEIFDKEARRVYRHPFEEATDEEGNTFRGTLSLAPIKSDSSTVELRLMRLQQAMKDRADRSNFKYYDELEFVEGEWNFDIPVKKHSSTVYDLDQETEVEGVPFRIEKLIVAPTATLLEYSYHRMQGETSIQHISLAALETENRTAEVDYFYGEYIDSIGEWASFQSKFDSLYAEDPDSVSLVLDSINVFVENEKTIELNQKNDFPQMFTYLGNELSIDSLESGPPTKLHITDTYFQGREYERLHFSLSTENQMESYSMGSWGEEVLVDREGNQYKPQEYYSILERIGRQPRHFQTTHEIELFQESSDDPIIPKYLTINGYYTTKYAEDKIDLWLE
ncbi:DUF4179 domain-containing protein [Bacillus sp. SCS-153A]|uniref:DUF4179 domain-containing protein n=1 Tax=Rossellomorea sedimentorum TaxID=3115294 RepID=UPI0039061234